MKKIQWLNILGWGQEEVEDLKVAGYSYIRQGKYDIALPFFRALVVISTDDVYSKQILGALYLQLGDPEKAVQVIEEAIQLDSLHAPTQLNRVKALIELGRIEDALIVAKLLTKHDNYYIADAAQAIVMAYS